MPRMRGLVHGRCVKLPLLLKEHVNLRLDFERQYRDFDWRRTRVRFSDECSVEVGNGEVAEWCFAYPYEKYDYDKVQEMVKKGTRLRQMVWGMI